MYRSTPASTRSSGTTPSGAPGARMSSTLTSNPAGNSAACNRSSCSCSLLVRLMLTPSARSIATSIVDQADAPTVSRGMTDPSTTADRPVKPTDVDGLEGTFAQMSLREPMDSRSSRTRSSVDCSGFSSMSCSEANLDPGAAPDPMPSRTRPGASDCTELMALASCAGCRLVTLATRTPMSTRSVTTPMAPRHTKGSRDHGAPTISPLK